MRVMFDAVMEAVKGIVFSSSLTMPWSASASASASASLGETTPSGGDGATAASASYPRRPRHIAIMESPETILRNSPESPTVGCVVSSQRPQRVHHNSVNQTVPHQSHTNESKGSVFL